MTKLRTYCIVFIFCATAVIASSAQNNIFSTVANFNGADGAWPGATPVLGSDGNIYGTTAAGGNSPNCPTLPGGCGTVFKMTPSGTLTMMYSFCPSPNCTDGAQPAWLLQGTDGTFYGTTAGGGAYGNYGTFFKITPTGLLTTLHSFDGADGSSPGMVVQATDGNFYGTTTYGGAYGAGTIFEITPLGVMTMLYSFCSQPGCPDGYAPGTLVQGTDGNFYGTKQYGGASDAGTIFRFILPNQLTTLYSFCSQSNCSDGAGPVGIVQASDRSFYGTTFLGGSPSCTDGCGTVFRISPEYPYKLTTLYRFDGIHGSWPTVGPVQAIDGNFYGTTEGGGLSSMGVIFQVTSTGTETALHSFNGNDGYPPFSGLVQARTGFFYGTAQQGGAYDDGTIFGLLLVRGCTTCQQ